MATFSTDQTTRLSCAGPILWLLEHLRMQDPPSAPSDEAAGATGMSHPTFSHPQLLAQLVLDTAAHQQAAEYSVVIHLHGGSGMQVTSASECGSQVLNVSNLGLSELPQDVSDAGTRSNVGNSFGSLSSSWVHHVA
jgi:hypothetical protein